MKRLNLKAGRDIADQFEASLTATLLKLVITDYFPIMIVCHSQTGRRWLRRPPSIKGFWFPKEDLDPESPAFDLLFRGGREAAFPVKLVPKHAFDFRGADRYEIQEQSFSLPNERDSDASDPSGKRVVKSIREAVTRTTRSERVAATPSAPRANDPRAIPVRFSISRSLRRAIATSSEGPSIPALLRLLLTRPLILCARNPNDHGTTPG